MLSARLSSGKSTHSAHVERSRGSRCYRGRWLFSILGRRCLFLCNTSFYRTALPSAAPFREAPRAPPERLHLVIEEKLVLKIERDENNNKEERYSQVPRLSDTRYSAKGTKGK